MKREPRRVPLVVLALSLHLSVTSGCCGEGAAEAQAGGGQGEGDEGSDGQGSAGAEPREPQDPTVAAVRKLGRGETWREPIEGVLSRWRGERQPMTDLLRATYKRRDYRPVFLDGLWPNAEAAALIKAVREVPSHGLPASPYRPKALIPLYESLALDRSAAEGTLTEPSFDNERLAKLEWQMPRTQFKSPRKSERVPEVRYRPLKELPELPLVSDGLRCALEAVQRAAEASAEPDAEVLARCGLGGQAEEALAAVREELDRRSAHKAELALLDAMLLQAFYQWALDFSVDYRIHPFKGNGPTNRSRLPREAQERLLKAFDDAQGAPDFAEALRGLLPDTPDYLNTRRALARYVKLMDGGEVDELRSRGWLKQGEEGDAVRALQERLAAEGYYDGPAQGVFDEATHQAVVRYQRTHGLADGGVVGEDTIESLNLPFEWRVKQLIASLGSWRESEIYRGGEPELYIRVNLPAYELRVIKAGEAIKRHRVIVGSNRRVEDPLNDGVVWHQRRTKLFETVVNEVVINPTWIVPEGIRVDEIQPKVRESSSYLEDHNFRKVGDLLVQGPHESNPLGVVKFSLESTDSIYLHDTDKRWLFNEQVRDLSHGCIRVDEPVELAKFLLKRQGVEAGVVDERVELGTTFPIKLDDPIPIFIEYNTVGSTDDGAPIFYSDIYGYNLAYWKKWTPITRRFP